MVSQRAVKVGSVSSGDRWRKQTWKCGRTVVVRVVVQCHEQGDTYYYKFKNIPCIFFLCEGKICSDQASLSLQALATHRFMSQESDDTYNVT